MAKLTEQEVRDFIKKNLKKGYSIETIKEVLSDRKVSKKLINEAAEHIRAKKIRPSIKMPKVSMPSIKPPNTKSMLIAVAVLVIVVAVALAFTLIPKQTADCGSDRLCFFDRANACQPAKLKVTELGTVYEFETEGCKVTKSIPKVSDDEPQEIQELLEGKSMTCYYEKNNFDPDIINSILIGIDPCSGELKDAIYILAIAQYQVAIDELTEQAQQLELLINSTL